MDCKEKPEKLKRFFFKPHFKVYGPVLFFVIVCGGFLFGVESAHAALSDIVFETLASVWLTVAGILLKLSIFVLRFIIEIASYNGYLDSRAVTVGWVMMRDVTNMFFVVILLLIAFGTILGLEQYSWKKMLIKFVLAAVLVNFSRTICGIIIDAAQVFMITFINGVAATAGGNLVNAFQIEKIMSLSGGAQPEAVNSSNIFGASIMAVVFSVMMLVSLGAYCVILVARMIVLWILIVLSPLAFVLSVLPQTQGYASEWWKEFGNHVVAGPVIIFFLWLSFVTVGAGNVHDEIAANSNNGITDSEVSAAGADQVGGSSSQAAGITSVMSWVNMANFFIAIGVMLVGVRITKRLGVVGGEMMGKVGEYGKKAAMLSTGAGFAYRKSGEAVGAVGGAAKFIGRKIPVVGGDAWKRYGTHVGGWLKYKSATMSGIGAEARGLKAKKWEKEGLWEAKSKAGKVVSGTLGKIGAMFWQPDIMRENKARMWKESGENAAKTAELQASASHTYVGLKRTETGVKLQTVERQKELKKQKAIAEQKEKQGVFEEEAKLSVAMEEEQRAEEEKKTEAIANVYEEKGDFIKAEAVRLSRYSKNFMKDSTETYNNLDQSQRMFEVENLSGKIDNARQGGNTVALQKLISQMAELTVVNNTKGAEDAIMSLTAGLKAIKWDENLTPENQNRAMLSVLLGKKVDKGRENESANELDKFLGGGVKAQGALKMLDMSTHYAAGEGAVGMAGFIKTEFDKKTGKTSYVINHITKPEDRENIGKVTEKYFMDRMNMAKMSSLANVGKVNIQDGACIGMDDLQAENFGHAFANKKALFMTRLTPQFMESFGKSAETVLNEKNDATQKQMMKEFKKMFTEVAKNVADKQAFESFAKARGINNLMEAIKENVDDIWKETGRPAEAPSKVKKGKSKGKEDKEEESPGLVDQFGRPIK
jgi:hypothetical protein